MGTGIIIDISMKDHLRAIILCAVYLDQRGSIRHHDYGFCTKELCRIGNPLGMIPGGCRDQSPLSLFRGKRTDLIIRSPNLIGTRILHVFRFQINLSTGLCTIVFAVDQICGKNHILHCLACFFEFI